MPNMLLLDLSLVLGYPQFAPPTSQCHRRQYVSENVHMILVMDVIWDKMHAQQSFFWYIVFVKR